MTSVTAPELTITAPQLQLLHDHLIQDDELERVAILDCSLSGDNRLLVENMHLLDDDEHETQKPTACRPDLDTEHELLSTCTDRGMHPAIVHSHPFADTPSFSSVDEQIIPELHNYVTTMAPDTTPVFGVIGQHGFDTATYGPDSDQYQPVPLTVLGDWSLNSEITTTGRESADHDTDFDDDRTDRTRRAFTDYGQQQLAATHIAVIGAGGLSSIIAEQLGRTGIGKLTVIDPDIVEPSNLNRLAGADDRHINQPKVTVTEDHLNRIAPDTEVTAIQARAQDAADTLKECDLLVAGVDRMTARMWLNQFSVRHLIPYVDAGVIIETSDTDNTTSAADHVTTLEGYIQFIVPGVTGCFSCLDRTDPELARRERLDEDELQDEVNRGYIDEADLTPEPAIAPLNGLIASKTVLLVSKWVTRYADPEHYIRFEDVSNTLTAFPTTPSDSCPVCGDTGYLGRGDRDATAAEVDTDQLDLTPTTTLQNSATEGTSVETMPDRVAAYFASLHPF